MEVGQSPNYGCSAKGGGRRVRVMKLFITRFSLTSYHFIPLWSKYSPQHPVLKHPLSMFLPYCQRSSFRQNYNLYFLIFTFLDSRREDESFWTEWQQALPEFNLLLISSWIKFWFVTVVPKYLNCAKLSEDVSYLYVMILLSVLVTRHQHMLSFLCVYF
jgi:hypothetical protein